jgi:hypothetical protein
MVIESDMLCMYKVGGIKHLAPGKNALSEDIGRRIIASDDFKAKEKKGLLRVIVPPAAEGSEAAKAIEEGSPLATVSPKKAIEVVADIQDVDQLRLIADKDTRPAVRAAAAARMDAIRKELLAEEAKQKSEKEKGGAGE